MCLPLKKCFEDYEELNITSHAVIAIEKKVVISNGPVDTVNVLLSLLLLKTHTYLYQKHYHGNLCFLEKGFSIHLRKEIAKLKTLDRLLYNITRRLGATLMLIIFKHNIFIPQICYMKDFVKCLYWKKIYFSIRFFIKTSSTVL